MLIVNLSKEYEEEKKSMYIFNVKLIATRTQKLTHSHIS